MNRVPCFLIVVIAAVLRFTEPASAHEFWIESSPFHPEPGTVVRVGLWHGERFAGDAVRRNDNFIEEFVLFGPGGSQPVVARDGMKTSFVRPQEPGLHVLGYRSR